MTSSQPIYTFSYCVNLFWVKTWFQIINLWVKFVEKNSPKHWPIYKQGNFRNWSYGRWLISELTVPRIVRSLFWMKVYFIPFTVYYWNCAESICISIVKPKQFDYFAQQSMCLRSWEILCLYSVCERQIKFTTLHTQSVSVVVWSHNISFFFIPYVCRAKEISRHQWLIIAFNNSPLTSVLLSFFTRYTWICYVQDLFFCNDLRNSFDVDNG